jgi:hypothetical protein
VLQLPTNRYNSFLESLGRKSGKKVQNAGMHFVRVGAKAGSECGEQKAVVPYHIAGKVDSRHR